MQIISLILTGCFEVPDNTLDIQSIQGPVLAADLNIANFYLYGGNQYRYFYEKDLVYLYLEIENIGNISSLEYHVIVYLYPYKGDENQKIPLFSNTYPPLGELSNEIQVIQSDPFEISNPFDFYGEYGEYVLTAFVDNEEINYEFNEANNMRSFIIRIYSK